VAVVHFDQVDYNEILFNNGNTTDRSLLYYFYIYDIYHELDEFHVYLCAVFSIFKFRVPYWFRTIPFSGTLRFRLGRSVFAHYVHVRRVRACVKTPAYFSNFYLKKTKRQNKKLSAYTPYMYQELTQPFFTEYVESFVEVPQTDENFSVYLGCTKSDSLLHIYFEDQLFFPALWDLGGFIECDLRVWHTLPEPAK
jgi:hypothetical protein